ncbi:MAG: ABC transporter ATP-binding protein [Acetobacteraceae bacterium]
MNAHPPLLAVRGLSARYGRVEALKGADLTVGKGEFVGVLGPNGAGKSTLLKAIMGLIASSGSIVLDGVAIEGKRTDRLAAAGLVMVPETRAIFGPLTVRENLDAGGWLASGRTELVRRREQAFALFPRLRERMAQPAGSLSGGEQQMLAIARAMMAKPRLLMLDEPSLGLAPRLVAEILAALGALNRDGLSILLIEQKAPLALKLAHRVYVLSVGRVVKEQESGEITSHADLAQYYLA